MTYLHHFPIHGLDNAIGLKDTELAYSGIYLWYYGNSYCAWFYELDIYF